MQTFSHLHSHPEVSWKEKHTTLFLKQRLKTLGLHTIVLPDYTGVVGIWEPADSSSVHERTPLTVALRDDMDALWQAVDGTWKANHYDDIIDHAELQAQLRTPICLDESIHSAEDVRKAIKLKSCGIVNIKLAASAA